MSNHWLVHWNWDTVTYELQTPSARMLYESDPLLNVAELRLLRAGAHRGDH